MIHHSVGTKVATYHTTDISLAAALMCYNYNVVDIQIDGRLGTFQFKNVDKRVIDDYWAGRLRVDPYQFYNNVKRLSSGIRNRTPK